jgi:hypothetical protein
MFQSRAERNLAAAQQEVKFYQDRGNKTMVAQAQRIADRWQTKVSDEGGDSGNATGK